jgi:GNAT superfamily N-acetyltransferase
VSARQSTAVAVTTGIVLSYITSEICRVVSASRPVPVQPFAYNRLTPLPTNPAVLSTRQTLRSGLINLKAAPMTTAIHLATADDAPRLLPLIAAFHAEHGLDLDDTHRENALMPLLAGSPLGAAWLFGLAKAPTGYVIITFGWSIEIGGMEAFVDELYIRPNVRKRGIASEVLMAISSSLADVGVKALHVEADRSDDAAQRLYAQAHFKVRDRQSRMTRML